MDAGMEKNCREANFYGLVGSTHNYSGLARGNIVSEQNRGFVSRLRDAFLQGLDHVFLGVRLGLISYFQHDQAPKPL